MKITIEGPEKSVKTEISRLAKFFAEGDPEEVFSYRTLVEWAESRGMFWPVDETEEKGE